MTDDPAMRSSRSTDASEPSATPGAAEAPRERRTLAIDLAVTSLNQIAGRGSAALLATVIARSLGAAQQGKLTLAQALVDVGCVIGALGLPQANSHHVAADRSRLRPLFGNSLIMSAIVGAAGLGAAITAYHLGGGGLGATLVACALLVIPLNVLSQLLAGLTWGVSDVRYSNAIQFGHNVLPLIPVVALMQLGRLTPTVAMAATASGLLFSCSAAAALLLAKYHARPQLSGALLRESLAYGVRWCGNSFLLMILDKGFFGLMAVARNGTSVAHLWVAMGVSDALQILPGASVSILLPRLSAIRSIDERLRTANRIGRAITGVMSLEAIVLIAAMPWLVPFVFGADYAPAVPGCIVLAIAYVSEGIGRTQYLFLAASQRHGAAIYASLFGGGLALAVAWPLMSLYGVLGAAIAVATGQLVTVAAQVAIARRECRRGA